ncbi:MAG: hypothetical protein QMD14_04090 [Candidatus Aenigmarchaeota archaeon]|nr:hypothetical protein [Candidatus Aenigmarchaeota archaeon]
MLRRIVTILIVAVVVGILAWSFLKPVPKEKIRDEIKRFYELAIPGTTVEVVSLEEESGIYKAVVKLSAVGVIPSYREAYVTKDGEIITENVIYMKRSSEQIEKLKSFVDCLSDKGVRIFGMLNATASPQGAQATTLQLNLLGRYSWKLYQSCDGPNLQACVDAGITEVPSVVIGRRIEAGVKTVDWFEQQTGCKLE